MAKKGFHHVAYACRDIQETVDFYTHVMGFDLIHTEVTPGREGGFFRHIFFDIGDGSCLAFFELHDVGLPPDGVVKTAVSTDLGFPRWVNHIAFDSTAENRLNVAMRLKDHCGREVDQTIRRSWGDSTYFEDPNGIMVELVVPSERGFNEEDRQQARPLLTRVPAPGDTSTNPGTKIDIF